MTINERVSDERLAHIRASYEASRKGWAFIGHPSYDESIAIIDELQQYRATEPVTVVLSSRAGNDTSTIDKALPEGFKLCAVPQVTSVPAVPDGLTIAREIIKEAWRLIPQSDSVQSAEWHTAASMFLNDSTAAPAVQAEQLSGNTEQVSQPYTLPDWLQQAHKLAELHGTSFVVFRHGEEAQCADPTKVIISFTDEGLGHHSAAPQQDAQEVKK